MGGRTLIETLVGSCFVRLWGYSWLDVIRHGTCVKRGEPIFNCQFSRREANVKYAKSSRDCGPRPLVFPCHILSAPYFFKFEINSSGMYASCKKLTMHVIDYCQSVFGVKFGIFFTFIHEAILLFKKY